VKHLNIPVTNEEYAKLADVKGERSWPEALREEFGIDE
jgi:hypothetical protein